MISLNQIVKGKRVRYEGTNRPWLKKNTDLRLVGQANLSGTSALVEFTNDLGNKSTEWVGLSSLSIVSNSHQATINVLIEKKKKLETEINGLNTAIAALEALND